GGPGGGAGGGRAEPHAPPGDGPARRERSHWPASVRPAPVGCVRRRDPPSGYWGSAAPSPAGAGPDRKGRGRDAGRTRGSEPSARDRVVRRAPEPSGQGSRRGSTAAFNTHRCSPRGGGRAPLRREIGAG